MAEDVTASKKVEKVEANEEGWPIFELWDKYETIAMHFNDLLIKLRTQALAAVAALSTIIGIFSKSGGETQSTWQVVAFAFSILLIFWIAIWVLDFCYYNPLLMGSVVALTQLEQLSQTTMRVRAIDISTTIERSVAKDLPSGSWGWKTRWRLVRGRLVFYSLVSLALVFGLGFSLYQSRSHTSEVTAIRFLDLQNLPPGGTVTVTPRTPGAK